MKRSRHPLRESLARTARIAAVAPLALVALAGCGDDDDDDAASVESEVRAEITEASVALEEEVTEASEALTEVSAAAADVADSLGDVAEDAVELAVRNLAARLGEEQFESAGYPLDGELSCEADVNDDRDGVDVDCTGTTTDGDPAALTGTTDELPDVAAMALQGSFTGTVDGTEVFSTDALG